jgi:predicted  nucleic acid-binding Zn-ribbon protein
VADELRTRLNTIETELVTANAELEMLRRTRNDLMNKVESQWSTISDYERALEEMGVHLSQYVHLDTPIFNEFNSKE